LAFKSSPVPPDHIKPYWMGSIYLLRPHFAKSTNAALKNENESFQTTESCLWVSVTTYKSIIILFMCFVFMMGYRLQPKGIDSDTLMCFRTKPDSVCSVSKRHHSVCSKKPSLHLRVCVDERTNIPSHRFGWQMAVNPKSFEIHASTSAIQR